MPDQFSTQLKRIKQITGTRTQAELAKFLGVHQPAVSSAVRRGAVPLGWLLSLLRVFRANPDWVLTGQGPVYIPATQVEENSAETGNAASTGQALRNFSARALTDELLRRIPASPSAANGGD